MTREERNARRRERYRLNPDKQRDASRQYYQNNRVAVLERKVGKTPEQQKDYDLRRHYGITLDQYNQMLDEQDGRCAVCRCDVPVGKGSWHVDHCHSSGQVRGLLCHHCNLMLGNAKDNTATLLRAVDYLNAANRRTAVGTQAAA